MVPQSVIDKAEALGIVPGAEVQWTSGHSNSGKFVVPPYDKWSEIRSGEYAWHPDQGAPNGHCWIIGSDYFTAKVINPPKPMAKFKVGDMVVCPRKPDNTTGPGWHPEMDAFIGKPMKVTGGTLYVRAEDWSWREDWLEPYTEEDDVIRVGDTVERIAEDHLGMKVGDTATVDDVGDFTVRLREYRGSSGEGRHSLGNLKKIKAGGPVSTTQKPSSHEQVPSEFAGQWDRCGEEQPVRAQRPTGRVVPAVADLGNPTRGKERRALVAEAQVQLPVGCKSDR